MAMVVIVMKTETMMRTMYSFSISPWQLTINFTHLLDHSVYGQKAGYNVVQWGRLFSLTRIKQGINQQSCHPSWRLCRRVCFHTTQLVGRTQFLAVVQLGSLFLCWVSAERPWPPRGLSLIFTHGFSRLSTRNSALNPSHTWNLTNFFCCFSLAPSWTKFSAFKDAGD